MSGFTSLILIDHVLLKVAEKGEGGDFTQTASGLYVANTEGKKVPSFGTLIQGPAQVTSESYRSMTALLRAEGAVVHYSTRRAYDYLPIDDPGFKYLFVPLDAIVAVDTLDLDVGFGLY